MENARMRARLTVEAGAAEPRVVDLSPEMTASLGRNNTNSLLLRDAKASRFQAEVFFAEGDWCVRNCSKTNATRLNGERIAEEARLLGGEVLSVGGVRIRFELLPLEENGSAPPLVVPVPAQLQCVASTPVSSGISAIDPEGLTTLLRFTNASLAETTPHALVTLALETVQQQTKATVCGYLSFDAEDSELRVVLPAGAPVNAALSQQLNHKVREGSLVWLNSPDASSSSLEESGSLAAYVDAVCVPLRRNPSTSIAAPFGAGPLGALHAYHTTRPFVEREVLFCEVLAGCLANALHILRYRRALEADNSRLRERAGRGGDELIGDSPAIRKLRADVANLASSPCSVLIEGESGVGKELVALALHRMSHRREGPLVTVNSAALTNSMSEAELFGHEKGAFTGAERARPGLFQQADEGTLFLDEIGELSQDTQARLLRVLEAKCVRPLMAKAEIKVDVRVIAATNRDLEKEYRVGRFRRDLFFRLGTRLRVPPLREHAEDVPALAAHFLGKLNLEYRRQVRLSPEALQRLQEYSWPGNVRQLRTVLETALAMSPVDVLRPADLRLGSEEGGPDGRPESLNLEELEARTIREAVRRSGGVLVKAARMLGIHRETLINKMRRYGIDRPGAELPEDDTEH
jgi:two-component system response regulator HydG